MYKKIMITITLLFLYFGARCALASPHEKINSGINYNEVQNTYTINSPGGHSSFFYNKAKEIEKNNSSVKVQGICLSSCSEYLLMVGKSLELENYPIIGMHGSPLVSRIVKREQHPDKEIGCLMTSANNLQELQEAHGVPYSYNLHQIVFLGVKEILLTEIIQNCQTMKISYENHFWLPTSDQLRRIMKLEFSGGTCADNMRKCKIVASRRWPSGTKLVIGTEAFVSVGIFRSFFL